MYGKEYKAWIARKAIRPHIVETFDTFKTFWAVKITLVNQTAIPASLHRYRMATVNNDDSVVSYGKSIANFRAAYTTTQESVKAQGTTIALMQGQLQAMQQYCMALQQQPPLAIYAPQQQQRGHRGLGRQPSTGHGYQAPTCPQPGLGGGQRPLLPPTPFKRFENWNYCSTHGGDIHNAHTSTSCQNLGPSHNPNATRTNTMGGLTVCLHKTILPLASGRIPPAPCQQPAPPPAMWQQPLPPVNFTPTMATMRPIMPTMPYQTPYQAIHYMGQPPPPTGVAPAPPAPPAGTIMMPYYVPHQQPPPF
jgi:hypothetical protein